MRLAFLPLALVALATSGTAFGACLLDDYSVRAEYARSAAVVVAKVVSDGKVPSFEPSDAEWGVTYTLKIKESFRGSLQKTVEVFSENSSGRFPLAKGKAYVLFLYEEFGRLSVDYCGNSGLVSQKHDVVKKLRAL